MRHSIYHCGFEFFEAFQEAGIDMPYQTVQLVPLEFIQPPSTLLDYHRSNMPRHANHANI